MKNETSITILIFLGVTLLLVIATNIKGAQKEKEYKIFEEIDTTITELQTSQTTQETQIKELENSHNDLTNEIIRQGQSLAVVASDYLYLKDFVQNNKEQTSLHNPYYCTVTTQDETVNMQCKELLQKR